MRALFGHKTVQDRRVPTRFRNKAAAEAMGGGSPGVREPSGLRVEVYIRLSPGVRLGGTLTADDYQSQCATAGAALGKQS